ncbi:MAG: hypothetical protein GZ091_15560 [Paludibacter sp.]|nr:hypothetical protein [Paludibacter sp.]
MEKELNITLPEWVFLDGNSHLGDMLENRVLLQHIQSYSIMELFLVEANPILLNPTIVTKEFSHMNIFGVNENHLLAVHFSLAGAIELDWIINRAIEFYKFFMDWQDASLIIEETSKDN